jgi:hypothetical protein
MSAKIFEYAVLHHPIATKEQQERGDKPRSVLIVDVKRVLANNEKEAAMLAARDIPDEFTDKLDRVEIALRPF